MIILAAGIAAFASPAIAQISFAPEAGLNLANMHWKFGDEKLDNGIKLGAKVGVNVNIPVGDRLIVQPGLFYATKGMKSEDDDVKTNITLHYAEIPVNIIYMFNDANEGRFFVGAGPYLGIAISGKNITSGGTSAGTEDLKFGSDSTQDLGRFDYGAQAFAGYFLRSGIFFRAAYQHGIGNLVPSEYPLKEDISIRNTSITVSIGYQLGGRKEASASRRQKAKADGTM